MNDEPLIIWVIVATLLIVGIITALLFYKRNKQIKSDEPSHHTDFRNDWYDGIAKQVNELKSRLIYKDYKKFKFNLLLCIAQRVAEFSSGCGQCMLFQQDITTLVKDAANLIQLEDKEGRKTYFKSINRILGHLQRHHKLVTEGYYTGICMALGAGIGIALGTATDYISSGIPIGVCIGLAIGAALDAKAKKDGRILYTRETTGSSKIVLVILGGLILLVLIGLVVFILLRKNL